MPGGVFLTKPIVPTQYSTHTLNAYILNAMKKTEKEIEKDYEATTATWTHKPRFDNVIQYAGGSAVLKVWTYDKIYQYIDLGTTVRYAVMSRDFVPKTSVGVIGSSVGAGKKAYVSKFDQGGIHARHFSFVIMTKHEPIFKQRIYDAIQSAMATPKGIFR